MVESPCVGVCRLEDGQCVGCRRTAYEIENWWEMSDYDKQRVLDRLLDDLLDKRSRYGY